MRYPQESAWWYTVSEMTGYKTRNEALKAIEEGIARKQYRLCTHIKFAQGPGPCAIAEYYYVVCEQDSFSQEPFDSIAHCPEDCRLYVDKTIARARQLEIQELEDRVQRRARFWKGVGKLLTGPFEWFAKLSGVAQGLIILLIIIYFAPRLADSIIKIIQAVK